MSAYRQIIDSSGNLITSILRIADGATIPADALNSDWQTYLAWLAAGNKPDTPDLTVWRSLQIVKLYTACDAYIAAGFTSGSYVYPMKLTDQQNRDSAFLDVIDTSLLTPLASINLGGAWLLWCRDASGVWARRSHTAAQVRSVRQDTRTQLIAAQTKLINLVAAVNAATTVTAIQAVAW